MVSNEDLPLPAAALAGGGGQRWNKRRTRYRPPGEIFDPSRASVEPIGEKMAKAFVETHHYSASYPAARFRAGVFVKNRFQREELCGVGVFSVPMNQKVIPSYFDGFEPSHGAELGRFVLLDNLATNAESWAIARMHRLLKAALPEVRGVLAYSDPLERVGEDGVVVKRGHTGVIYRAVNAHYRGRSAARTLWLSRSGVSFADRTLSKLRLEERGARYASEQLAKAGAPRQRLGESGAAYVCRLKRDEWLRPLRHPGNFAFTWSLDRPRRPLSQAR